MPSTSAVSPSLVSLKSPKETSGAPSPSGSPRIVSASSGGFSPSRGSDSPVRSGDRIPPELPPRNKPGVVVRTSSSNEPVVAKIAPSVGSAGTSSSFVGKVSLGSPKSSSSKMGTLSHSGSAKPSKFLEMKRKMEEEEAAQRAKEKKEAEKRRKEAEERRKKAAKEREKREKKEQEERRKRGKKEEKERREKEEKWRKTKLERFQAEQKAKEQEKEEKEKSAAFRRSAPSRKLDESKKVALPASAEKAEWRKSRAALSIVQKQALANSLKEFDGKPADSPASERERALPPVPPRVDSVRRGAARRDTLSPEQREKENKLKIQFAGRFSSDEGGVASSEAVTDSASPAAPAGPTEVSAGVAIASGMASTEKRESKSLHLEELRRQKEEKEQKLRADMDARKKLEEARAAEEERKKKREEEAHRRAEEEAQKRALIMKAKRRKEEKDRQEREAQEAERLELLAKEKLRIEELERESREREEKAERARVEKAKQEEALHLERLEQARRRLAEEERKRQEEEAKRLEMEAKLSAATAEAERRRALEEEIEKLKKAQEEKERRMEEELQRIREVAAREAERRKAEEERMRIERAAEERRRTEEISLIEERIRKEQEAAAMRRLAEQKEAELEMEREAEEERLSNMRADGEKRLEEMEEEKKWIETEREMLAAEEEDRRDLEDLDNVLKLHEKADKPRRRRHHKRPPPPPTITAIEVESQTSILLEWEAPGGHSWVGWSLIYQLAGNDWSEIEHLECEEDQIVARISGLRRGTWYDICVCGHTEACASEPSLEESIQTYVGVPDSPMIVTASSVEENVKLSWDAPAFDGGMDLVGYSVHYCLEGTNSWVDSTVCDPETNSYTVTDLKPGANYSLVVRAVNQHGRSAPSSEIQVTVGSGEQPEDAVASFLRNYSMEKFIAVFAENEITTMDLVFDLTDADLKEMDVSIGARKNFHKSVVQYREDQTSVHCAAPPPPPPPSGDAAPTPPPPPAQQRPHAITDRTDLLSSIRSGTKLRKVSIEAESGEKAEITKAHDSLTATLLNAISARRTHLKQELEDSDYSDEEGSDWDSGEDA